MHPEGLAYASEHHSYNLCPGALLKPNLYPLFVMLLLFWDFSVCLVLFSLGCFGGYARGYLCFAEGSRLWFRSVARV